MAIADQGARAGDDIDAATMNALTDQAADLLSEQQRGAAAAMFDAARRLKPSDLTAKNNFAFCILVDSPNDASVLLREVAEAGAPSPEVTECNLALASYLAGRREEALQSCDRAWSLPGADRQAYLWVREEDDVWIPCYVTIRTWLIQLGAQIERAQNLAGSWVAREHAAATTGPFEGPSSTEIDGAGR
jgi:hypothetical protein